MEKRCKSSRSHEVKESKSGKHKHDKKSKVSEEKHDKRHKNTEPNEKHHKFDLELVLKSFQGCLQRKDNQINLQEYINAFTELTRFFRFLSPIFGFVSSDLEEKLQTLEKHKSSSQSQHYETVETMIAFETAKKITRGKTHGLNSGSRCILRLNRALEFVLQFMDRIKKSSPKDEVSEIASEVYEKTLAKHHVWIVRKMAGMAVYTLPNREHFLENMCKHSEEEGIILVENVIETAMPVFSQINSLLDANQLMDIP